MKYPSEIEKISGRYQSKIQALEAFSFVEIKGYRIIEKPDCMVVLDMVSNERLEVSKYKFAQKLIQFFEG